MNSNATQRFELKNLSLFPNCFPCERLRAQLALAQTCGWQSQWYFGWGTFTSVINTAIEDNFWKRSCLEWKFIPYVPCPSRPPGT